MAYAPKIEWAKQWLSETKKPYINGQFVHGSGKVMESINPATNEVIGTFETCTEEDVNKAVAAARKAFDEGPWTKVITHKERAVIMHKLSQILRDHV